MKLRSAARGIAALLVAGVAACDGSPTGGDVTPVNGEVTLNGSTGWAYADLDAAAPAVTVGSPGTDASWDIAVNGTSVMLNGGDAGPGGTVGHCLCANESATNDQVKAFTAAAELADFEVVTSREIPAQAAAWTSEALTPAITGWGAYSGGAGVADPGKVFFVRTAEGNAWAKLHVLSIADATQQHAGRVTIEYALRAATGTGFGAPRTATINVASGRAYFDLATGAVSSAADWDIALEGWTMRVNGGASGGGQGGAVAAGASFADAPDPSAVPASAYRGDTYGGVFAAHPWYRYNLEGNHQIHPVYNVYLLKRGSTVFKVQLTSYYGPAGETRRITLWYAKIAG